MLCFWEGVVLPFGERAFVLGGKHFAGRFMSSQYYLLAFALLAFWKCYRQHATSVSSVSIFLLQSSNLGTGKMDQQLKALTALPKDPGTIPSPHMAAYNCL